MSDLKQTDAETYLRERYGAYRGHPEWRALEEAFNAGRRTQPEATAPAQDLSAAIRKGWEGAAKALAERAAGHFRAKSYSLQDECLQCASMLHDLKPAASLANALGAADRVDAELYRSLKKKDFTAEYCEYVSNMINNFEPFDLDGAIRKAENG